MTREEIALFRNRLQEAKVYFEFGLGGSTLIAAKMDNIERVAGIDSKKEWRDIVLSQIQKKDKLDLRYIPMGECTRKGTPKVKDLEIWEQYPMSIHEFDICPDLILIDGRFRMACIIQTILLSRKLGLNPEILLHDAQRPDYKEVSDFCEEIQRVSGRGKEFLLLKPRTEIKADLLNERYEHYKHLTT